MDKNEYLTLIPLFDELSGPRVLLRHYREEDAQSVNEAISESRDHLRPWLPFADQHQSLAETRDWLIRSYASWLLREGMAVGVWEHQTGRFLGGADFHANNWDARAFEIGYWLRASAAGQGYMTEAVRLTTTYLFTNLSAHRVEIRCDERNRRSAAIPRRLGFVEEACLRSESLGLDGNLRNTLIFALTSLNGLLS